MEQKSNNRNPLFMTKKELKDQHISNLRAAGYAEQYIYAFEKLEYFVTQDNFSTFSKEEQTNWHMAVEEYWTSIAN